jgi:hypothetical protein
VETEKEHGGPLFRERAGHPARRLSHQEGYYFVFKDAGVEITLAFPKGGRPPMDPKSNEPEFRTDLTRRFEKDAAAEARLDKTVRLDSVKQEDSTPSSIRAATARCGISPKTRIPSS